MSDSSRGSLPSAEHLRPPRGPAAVRYRPATRVKTGCARHEVRKPFAARMEKAKALRAMADLPLARSCPYQSLAPVLSIIRLVATTSKEVV
jgi:hypothetical protein